MTRNETRKANAEAVDNAFLAQMEAQGLTSPKDFRYKHQKVLFKLKRPGMKKLLAAVAAAQAKAVDTAHIPS